MDKKKILNLPTNLDGIEKYTREDLRNRVVLTQTLDISTFYTYTSGVYSYFVYNFDYDFTNLIFPYRHPMNKVIVTLLDSNGNPTSLPKYLSFDSKLNSATSFLSTNTGVLFDELNGDETNTGNIMVGMNYTFDTSTNKAVKNQERKGYLYLNTKTENPIVADINNRKVKMEIVLYEENLHNTFGFVLDKNNGSIYPAEQERTSSYSQNLKSTLLMRGSIKVPNPIENDIIYGSNHTVEGNYSFVSGFNNKVSRNNAYSFLHGADLLNTVALEGDNYAYHVTMIGEDCNNTVGKNNITMIGCGLNNDNKVRDLILLGKYGDASADTLFALANGGSENEKNICFEIKEDGKVLANGEVLNPELETITTANATATLSTNKYQEVTLVNDDTIVLPTVTKFTEIHLFFDTTSAINITFPEGIAWQNGAEPVIGENRHYELIFTYRNGLWLGGYIEYIG